MTKSMGLTQKEADKLLKKNGLNQAPEPRFNFFKAFVSKLWNLSAWILEIALILEFALGKWIQSSFILLMLIFAALNGANQKRRSRKVLDKISKELIPIVSVERDGKWKYIESKELVNGDIVSIKSGDVLAADMEVNEGLLTIDESSVTGESRPIKKKVKDTIYAGTTIVSGSAVARVTATGIHSRAGKTINLINTSAAPGHLQQLLTKIIFALCTIALALTAVVLITAIIRKDDILSLLPFLAMMFIASIPVAMPSTFAVSNSVEAKKLSKEGILTADLTGIQDAANLNLFLLDKTGTITKNKTSVTKLTNFTDYDDKQILSLLSAAIDNRNAGIIDQALMNFLKESNINSISRDSFIPFSSSKGYSEAETNGHNIKLGSFKILSKIDPTAGKKITNISFGSGRSVAILIDNKMAGVFILKDQIRHDSKQVLRELKSRGIKPIMLTGDNQRTAAAVAKEVGLIGSVISVSDFNDNVDFSEISGIADVLPEDKLNIVKTFQSKGYIVGMTGDGVNDAPALKQAEVGVAMSNAADVAKRSSKMVMLKDGLAPLLNILDAGHRVYQRMTTWALTKIAKTSELTVILTLGYLLFRYLPISFNSMVLYSVLNTLVVISIATDNVTVSKHPENWNILKLTKISLIICIGWVVFGIGLLLWLANHGYSRGEISTMNFLFLVYTALITVPITRTDKFFWQSKPSNWVIYVEAGDAVLSSILALLGWAMPPITLQELLLTLTISLVAAIVVDFPYCYYKKR